VGGLSAKRDEYWQFPMMQFKLCSLGWRGLACLTVRRVAQLPWLALSACKRLQSVYTSETKHSVDSELCWFSGYSSQLIFLYTAARADVLEHISAAATEALLPEHVRLCMARAGIQAVW